MNPVDNSTQKNRQPIERQNAPNKSKPQVVQNTTQIPTPKSGQCTSPGGFQENAKGVRDFTSTAVAHEGGLVELDDLDEPFRPVDELPAL